MKSKIPKKFQLFANTIDVVVDNDTTNNESALGLSDYTNSLISLCDNYKGAKLNEGTVVDTFYHEKVHMILDAMNDHKLSRNERFVDVFSKLLRQADESSEY